MPDVPAVCDRCGTAFRSGISMGVGASAQLIGNMSGPCPRCGSMGTIPNGYYAAASETSLLKAASLDELRRMLNALNDFRTGRASREEAASRLAESGPAGEKISKQFLSRPDRMELWTFVAMVAAIVSVLVAIRGSKNAQPATTTLEVDIDVKVNQQTETELDIDSIVQNALDQCYGKTVLPAEEPRSE